ncbi:MAG: hypothetical protein FWD68_19205 [Alphaproteobacteria bacterium]|nr:hypothetical protein [Alphaproteobacteria bacterium]
MARQPGKADGEWLAAHIGLVGGAIMVIRALAAIAGSACAGHPTEIKAASAETFSPSASGRNTSSRCETPSAEPAGRHTNENGFLQRCLSAS